MDDFFLFLWSLFFFKLLLSSALYPTNQVAKLTTNSKLTIN